MQVSEIVRRLKVEATQSGIPEVTASLKGLSGAQDGIVASSEKMTKSQLSVAAMYERQQRQLDINYRMTQQFEKAQRTLDQALQQGIVTAQRYAELSALNVDKHSVLTKAANDNTTANSLNQMQLLELGHVAKATFEQIAAGAPALRVLAQQGASTAQAMSLNPGGLGGTLTAMGSAAVAFLGPAGLVAAAIIAITAAAVGLFEYLKTAGPTAEKLLAEHNRLLGVIKDSYDSVTGAASKWYQQSRDVTQLQLLQQEIDLRQKLQGEIGKTISSLTTYGTLGDFFSGQRNIQEKFLPFEDALFKLKEGFKQGAPNVREFVDEIARISLLGPALQKIGNDLINSVGDASKLDYALKQIADAKKLIAGLKLGDDERGRLGLPGMPAGPAQINAYDQLIQKTKDHIGEMNLEASVTGLVSDAVLRLKLQHDAERAAKKANVEVNQQQLDQLKEELSLADRRVAQSRIDAQISFADKTKFLSAEDVQIAQQLAGKYNNDIPAAMASTEAATIRLQNAQELTIKGFRDVGESVFSAAITGKNAMDAMVTSLDNVAAKMAKAGFNNFVDGLISVNPLQMGLGAAQAAGSAVISAFTKDQKNAEALKKAQDEWAKAGPAFQKFLIEMSGGACGGLSTNVPAKPLNDNQSPETKQDDCDQRRKVA